VVEGLLKNQKKGSDPGETVRQRLTASPKRRGQAPFSTAPLSLPIIATVSRLFCRELTLQVEYLQAENRILRSKVKNRVVFTEVERRRLVDAALAMGIDLMRKVVTIVKPETILVWQRKLERQKWDYSDRRVKKSGQLARFARSRPPTARQTCISVVPGAWAAGHSRGYSTRIKSQSFC
jgi:hypothetical protein